MSSVLGTLLVVPLCLPRTVTKDKRHFYLGAQTHCKLVIFKTKDTFVKKSYVCVCVLYFVNHNYKLISKLIVKLQLKHDGWFGTTSTAVVVLGFYFMSGFHNMM